MKYRTIYADPPWITEQGGGKIKRSADRNYPLMLLLYIGMKLDQAANRLDRVERWIYEERKRKYCSEECKKRGLSEIQKKRWAER